MTDVDQPILQEPEITTPKRRLSSIWLLPLIALMIGLWLTWRAFIESGVTITVQFPNAEGLEAGKTNVIYNGLTVGKVNDLALTPDFSGVNVHIEMSRQMSPYLTKNASFWLVKPTVSMAGISGLNTLFSGNYIGFLPGTNTEESDRVYIAKEASPAIKDPNALHITLRTNSLDSVAQGNPVYYRRLQVGEVISYKLSPDNQHVDIQIFIQPTYAKLVRTNTRFWNAGGIEVSGGLSGFKVKTQSILSILKGGIAFSTSDYGPEQPAGKNDDTFTLYDDYNSARSGIPIDITFPTDTRLKEGSTRVMLMGFEIGIVKSVQISGDLSFLTARVSMDPRAEQTLVEGTRFWAVKPQISIAGISSVDALLNGSYISMDVNLHDIEANKPCHSFKGLDQKPTISPDAPGLHLELETPTLAGVSVGSPILYRQIQIGSVQKYTLAPDNRTVRISIHINPEFAHLVNRDSRFWNFSGIHIKADLSGMSIDTGTLVTLMNGGIGLVTPDLDAQDAHNGDRFLLHSTEQEALETGLIVHIRFDSGDGLQVGTLLKLRGVEIGKVKRVWLDNANGKPKHTTIVADTMIYHDSRWLAREGTDFWLVKPELGLARTANLETLLKGQYILASPASKVTPEQTEFIAKERAPLLSDKKSGLKIKLVADRLGSITKGSMVYYREIPVGEVVGYRLGNPADHVVILLTIDNHYASLITPDTRFWNASGIDVDIGLFSGAKIHAESMESLLAGGIAFATPVAGTPPAKPNTRFKLYEKADSTWLDWKPAIKLEHPRDNDK